MKEKVNIRFVVLLLIIVLVGAWRILTASSELSAWSNFSPIGAMALFGGSYFMQRYKSYLFPLLVLFLSDFVLMQTIYAQYGNGILYDQWYWTYGSFALMVLIGEVLIKKVSFKSVLMGSIAAGLVHYVFSNFGVWLKGGIDPVNGLPYTRDLGGLINCYIAAIPFFKNLLLGNMVFGALLFGGFELARSKFEILNSEIKQA
mgnify:CR=1 FL=1